ncbi:MAG: flavodoxin family protein [Clostridiales bacterium]|nr:flavodoxin family protein [Clostridiales bacterium]
MKKILIINASMRRKSNYALLKRIETHLESFEVEFLEIKNFDIRPCVGCENCLRNGQCNIKDDAEELLGKMSKADGIIIGTPVYIRQISGYLKMLIDRGCAWYHRSPLVGKPIFFVTSTQVSGSKQALSYLKDVSVQWGTIYTGALSRTMFNLENEVTPESISKFLYYMDESNKKHFKPSMKQIFEFYTQKVLAIHVLPLDLEFWTENGYLDQHYYYDCKINIFKRIIGYAYFRMLSHFIGKNKSQ